MMKRGQLFHIILLSAIFLTVSCSKTEIPVEPPIIEEPTEDEFLLWKRPLHPDTIEVGSVNELGIVDFKILTSANPLLSDSPDILLCYNSNGGLEWEWDSYELEQGRSISNLVFLEDGIFMDSYYDEYKIDVRNGNTIWSNIRQDGGFRPHLASQTNIIKSIWYSAGAPRSDSTSIFLINAESGEDRSVFTIINNEEVSDGVGIPSVTMDIETSSDTILYFQNNRLVISPYSEKIDFYKYNLTQDKVEWMIENISIEGWNVHPPQMDEDNIYFATKFRFFSIDKITGSINWERKLYWDFQGSNYVMYDDVIMTNLDNGDLIGLSKHTGEILWIDEDLSACCTYLTVVEDKLYFANGNVFVVNPKDGKVLFEYETRTKEERGRRNALFLGGVAVQADQRRIYATDGYYLHCIEMPEM